MPDRILQRIKTITREEIYSWIDEYITTNKGRLVKLIQERLKRGQSVHNLKDAIGYYASESYEIMKERENPLAGGTVDLFLEGDFQRFITIERKSKQIYKIYSKDAKYKKLGEKYGYEQIGLTEEQHEELKEELIMYCYDKIISKMLG